MKGKLDGNEDSVAVASLKFIKAKLLKMHFNHWKDRNNQFNSLSPSGVC